MQQPTVSEVRYSQLRCTHVTNSWAAERIDATGLRPARAGYGSAVYVTTGQFAEALDFYTNFVADDAADAVVYTCTTEPGRCLRVELPVEWVEVRDHEEVCADVAEALASHFGVVAAGVTPVELAAAHGYNSLLVDCAIFDSSYGGQQLAVWEPERLHIVERHRADAVDAVIDWCVH